MTEPNQSFYASPNEAMQAPPEEFLYLACLHEGTGVRAPDFVAVVDADTGRVVHETPMPNLGDELHHFGWNRCSSACHGPDRSHLMVPGFRSSRIASRSRACHASHGGRTGRLPRTSGGTNWSRTTTTKGLQMQTF